MPILTVTTEVQITAQFRGIDQYGNAVSENRAQGGMAAITPLCAMEMYEHFHAARNKLRREAGLSEIPTPDEGLLVLGFLRMVMVKEMEVRETPNLADLAACFQELVREVQRNRLDETLPGLPSIAGSRNGQEAAEVA